MKEKHFFIGSTNPGKIREIGSILSATGFTFEKTEPVDPEETEPDFEGNALLKARIYGQHAGGPTISEDSGLVIPALGGLPGPWSARFDDFETFDVVQGTVRGYRSSGRQRSDIDLANNKRVLELMRGIKEPQRNASFQVVLAVADGEGNILFKSSGKSSGFIAREERGGKGFGYDPIFIGKDTFGKTYAELDSMRKNNRSHRRRVLDDLKKWLQEYALSMAVPCL